MQTANLINEKGLVDAEVQVTAFPNNPGIVEYAGRYYGDPLIGEDNTVIEYTRKSLFVVSRDGYVTAGI